MTSKETKERLASYGTKYENKTQAAQKKAYDRFKKEFNRQKKALQKKGITITAKLPNYATWRFIDKADYVSRREAMYTGSRKTMGNRQRDIAAEQLAASGDNPRGGSIPGFQKLLSKYGYKATLQEIKYGKWNNEITKAYQDEKKAFELAHPELDASTTGFGARFSESFSQEWFESK